ncbi:anti-sigma F factor antagonist [Treponema pallidum subsp. pallidum SS14]|uniref:Anti-sigma factor antagonist n=6 Tax=Treponema TaxID=157 RepID=O83551_TREPA|nr:anti-sigma F factor antagonist (spoIIAA-2) [Treponema pallidum subsp. pallidum str. Nichols]ACD70961.1 anti-sigma F factor antagonist [Treponema pallidum subsp. pallidum SS14]AFU66537.1 anti sigma factor antagonist [Treponema pallidum subsp. pallidum str. Mexico A]QCQ79224.1 anti sigma factor antagonist [Treponema pallidum subsp. pallidum]AGN75727.1 anti sigma factor antagonist [Treponema pallidum subsp. pallidum str. Nichols]
MPMELKVRQSGGICVVDISGDMDLYHSYKLKDLVLKLFDRGPRCIVIDLEAVEYIDSSGIGVLIYLCSTVKKLKIHFFISGVHGSVKKVIELTRLLNYFPIAESVDEALARARSSAPPQTGSL